MSEIFTPVSGVTSADPKITDFTIGGDNISVEIMDTPIQDTQIVEANQNRERKYWYTCVPHATMACIADLFNLSQEDYLSWTEKVVAEAVRLGKLDLNSGMAVADAVDIARKLWNAENTTRQVASFRIPFADANLKLALDRGHSLVTAYRGGPTWNADFNADGVLNKSRYSPITYGHSVRLRKGNTIIDNYIGVQAYNRYKVVFISQLVGPHFWDCFYIFLPVDKLTDSQKNRLMAQKSGLWNGQRENWDVTMRDAVTMTARAYRIKNHIPLDPSNASYVNDFSKYGIILPVDLESSVKREKMAEMVKKMLGSVKWSEKNPTSFITRGELAEILQVTLTTV